MSENTQTAPTGTSAIEAAAAALKQAEKPAEATATTTTQGEPDAGDEALGDAGKKALKAERDARAVAEKALAEAKAKLDQIEAANMSDLERAQKEAAEAKEIAAKATADALRFRVAAQHGISDEDAELFLTGADLDTLTKQATRLKDRAPTGPQPDLSQAATPPALNSDGLTEALARAVGAS
jgi:hypothetical protein